VALLASIAVPVAAVAWTVEGPLRPGWARRAGTPAALLGSQLTSSAGRPTGVSSGSAPPAQLVVPFHGAFEGTQQQSSSGRGGQVSVTISGRVSGSEPATLKIVLFGEPGRDGGVQLTSSRVTLGPTGQPDALQGQVSQLNGSRIVAVLTGEGKGPVTATIQLQLTGTSAVTGTVQVAS
jgi:hypothetical protein